MRFFFVLLASCMAACFFSSAQAGVCGRCTRHISWESDEDQKVEMGEILCIAPTALLTGRLIVSRGGVCNEGEIYTQWGIDITDGKFTNFGSIKAHAIDEIGESNVFNFGILRSDYLYVEGAAFFNSGEVEAAYFDTVGGARTTNHGNIWAQRVTVTSGALLENEFKIHATYGFTTNSGARLENRGSVVTNTFEIDSGASVRNAGTLQTARWLTMSSGGALDNEGELTCAHAFISSGAALSNHRHFTADRLELRGGRLHNQSRGDISGDLRLDSSGALLDNSGPLSIGGSLFIAPKSTFATETLVTVERDFENNGNVSGSPIASGPCGGFIVKGVTLNTGRFGAIGRLDMCDLGKPNQGFDANFGTIGKDVSFCRCGADESKFYRAFKGQL